MMMVVLVCCPQQVVRCLLGHARAATTLNSQDRFGCTAVNLACWFGHGAILRLLLEAGADPTIDDNKGWTPWAHATDRPPPRYIARAEEVSAEGRRECAAALEVRGGRRGCRAHHHHRDYHHHHHHHHHRVVDFRVVDHRGRVRRGPP
jgi:hypothetical protein